MRYVIVSEELGMYLGSFMGMGFWSNLDPAGQTHAPTYESSEGMQEFIDSWETKVHDARIVQIDFDRDMLSADGCVQLGFCDDWTDKDGVACIPESI